VSAARMRFHCPSDLVVLRICAPEREQCVQRSSRSIGSNDHKQTRSCKWSTGRTSGG